MPATPSYEGFPVPSEYMPWESSLAYLNDGSILMTFSNRDTSIVMGTVSKDDGQTWQPPHTLRTVSGKKLEGCRTTVLRLKSGALGLFHSTPWTSFGRDGALMFHKSTDEGATWTEGVYVDPRFSLLRNGCATLLQDGRIIAPTYHWITPHLKDAEQDGVALSYSYSYYSDDEGESWLRSVNELFVKENEVAYDFVDNKFFRLNEESRAFIQQSHHLDKYGEPTAVELTDGRLLCYGRTRMGRIYQSISHDSGETWSVPAAVEINSSDSPMTLKRIPKTGDLLLIWNQATPEEILSGLHRHRLSTAISKDEGKTWTSFKNLESLDDAAQLEPPPVKIYQMVDWTGAYQRPEDTQRYHRIPGYLRAAYPDVAFKDDTAVVCYDCGRRLEVSGPPTIMFATRVKVLPINWFYQT